MSKQELLEYLIDLSYKTRRLINLIKDKNYIKNYYIKNLLTDNINQDPKFKSEIFNSISTDTIKAVLQPKIKEIVSSCKKSVELIPHDCQEKFYAKILRSSAQKISDFIPELEKDYDSYNDYLNVVKFFLITLYFLYNSISDYLDADINKQNISREKSRIKINEVYKSVIDLKLDYKPICFNLMRKVEFYYGI